jgi:acyl carrier protein
MSEESISLQKRVCAVFGRVFRQVPEQELIRVTDLEEWDSLSHIKLMMELEREFDVQIDPDAIADLYSDTQHIIDYLQNKVLETADYPS